jgi:hypothetical protein
MNDNPYVEFHVLRHLNDALEQMITLHSVDGEVSLKQRRALEIVGKLLQEMASVHCDPLRQAMIKRLVDMALTL